MEGVENNASNENNMAQRDQGQIPEPAQNNPPQNRRRNGIDNGRYEIEMLLEKGLHLAYTKSFLYVTIVISVMILGYLNKVYSNTELTLKDLEDEEMNMAYFLLAVLFSTLIWDLFLIINKLVFKLDKHYSFEEITTADSLFFNPIIYNLFLYWVRGEFMTTFFDAVVWWIFSFTFGINYFSTINVFNSSQVKLLKVSNYQLIGEMLNKIRLNYTVLIIVNIIFTFFLKFILEDAPFLYKYVLLFKGVYLASKQVEYWAINEINFARLKHGNNEDFIFTSNSLKLYLQVINKILILHVYVVADNYYLFSGAYFPCGVVLVIIFNLIGDIMFKIRSYRHFKDFMQQLNTIFPKLPLDNDQEECSICKDTLQNARKLSCNHNFHLMCLSKWVENGNKNCPLCRKDITTPLPRINSGNSWSFGFRVQGNNYFSWIPNIQMRVVRTQNQGLSTEEAVNTVSGIFPHVSREDILNSLNRTRNINLTVNEFLLGE